MKPITPDSINAFGHAGGWHAQLLQQRAAQQGETMAQAWRREVAQSVAFSVPAVCTAVSKHFVEYRFADGSTDSYKRTTHE